MKRRLTGYKISVLAVAISAAMLFGLSGLRRALAQSTNTDWQKAAGEKMAFDVSSVKQNLTGYPPTGVKPHSNFPVDPGDAYSDNGGFFDATNWPVYVYIAFAYKLTSQQEDLVRKQLPKWCTTDHFDIEARAKSNPTKDQMRLMMQSLLADRFNVAAGPGWLLPVKPSIRQSKMLPKQPDDITSRMPLIALKNEQSRFLLLTFILYLIARTLQLFAGKVPSLLIVILTVIPPALFALIHGARIYRPRGIFVFAALSLGIGTLFESVSLRTGFPFGHYWFTDLMGPKLFNLPILLALAYVGMGYLSWVLALMILDCQDELLSGRNVVLLPLLASFVMTAWDLSMDPVWADIDHAWVWRDGGSYYGVPISNFVGWILTTYVFYQLFALYVRNRASVPSPAGHWRLAVLFYTASAAGNLLVVAPASLGAVFVDPTGRHWMIAAILRASRLVSIFLMMPLSLIAWVKSKRLSEVGRRTTLAT